LKINFNMQDNTHAKGHKLSETADWKIRMILGSYGLFIMCNDNKIVHKLSPKYACL
jgi:hypothetical protein